MNTQLQTINFYNRTLATFEQNGIYYTAMKPICENIGLAWEPQLLRIKRDDVLNSTMIITIMVAEDGKKREMICLPIDYLNGWLFGIDVKRVKPEIRDTLITYKKECYKALHDYWVNGKAERSTTTVDDRTGLRDAVNMIVSKKGLLYSDAYSLIHQYMNVQHIDEIPKAQLPAAVAYCHKIVLEGELILNTPEETERKLNLNSEGVNAIINCYYTATRMQEAVQFLLNQLNTFRSTSLDSVRFNCEVMERYIREAHPHVEGLVKQRYRSKTPLMPQIGY
ncbi:phage antirepressor N-terminal domain-containing protein [Testudinibacter sp. P80/BLE/0925]